MRSSLLHDYIKAYRKARSWDCSLLRASYRALRYAVTGDSGHFKTHGGWRVSRIIRDES